MIKTNQVLQKLEAELTGGINRSYSEFKEYQNRMIERITSKAQKTPVYKDKIIKVIDNIEDIDTLPLISYDDITSAINAYGLENCLLKPYKVKVQTAGSTGIPKKFYYGTEDLEKFALIGGRCGYLLGLKKGDVGWGLTAPSPYISGILIHLGAYKIGLDLINTPITSANQLVVALKKVSKVDKYFKGIYGFPSILLTIAQISNNPQVFEERVKEKMKEKLGLVKLLTKAASSLYLRGINYEKIKNIITNVEIVLSGGESLEPYKEKLKSFYPNAGFFDVYGSSELGIGMAQLLENGYLNPMLDWFIPEIAKPEEIRKAKKDHEYILKAIPWWEWYKGLRGELIVTRDGDCLPLIRYPTGDLVEVVDPRKNIILNLGCGKFQTILPEVKILGRSIEILPPEISEDEMLIYSVARVYPSEIKVELNRIPSIKVKHYDLYIYKPNKSRVFPKWKIEVIPEERVINKEKLEQEIKRILVKKTEIHETQEPLSLGYSKEFVENLFEVKILEPEAYKKVELEMEKRISEGKPLGQIKPSHVHFVNEEINEQ